MFTDITNNALKEKARDISYYQFCQNKRMPNKKMQPTAKSAAADIIVSVNVMDAKRIEKTKKQVKLMRGISSLADIGAIGGGFISIWMVAEPVTGITAAAVIVAVSRLVKRGADDREKRMGVEIQETGDYRLLREIESIKSTVNLILVILLVSVVAYCLRSFSLVEWFKYILIAVVFMFLIIVFLPSAPADIEDNK